MSGNDRFVENALKVLKEGGGNVLCWKLLFHLKFVEYFPLFGNPFENFLFQY